MRTRTAERVTTADPPDAGVKLTVTSKRTLDLCANSRATALVGLRISDPLVTFPALAATAYLSVVVLPCRVIRTVAVA